jgi:hypothetical protein
MKVYATRMAQVGEWVNSIAAKVGPAELAKSRAAAFL